MKPQLDTHLSLYTLFAGLGAVGIIVVIGAHLMNKISFAIHHGIILAACGAMMGSGLALYIKGLINNHRVRKELSEENDRQQKSLNKQMNAAIHKIQDLTQD